MKFTKMHGCGNDYIFINGFNEKVESAQKAGLAVRLSDRHYGIGGDGVIFINPSRNADFEMEMYNADGSRAEMCGNGIRCVGKYVYDKKMTSKVNVLVESGGKIKDLEMIIEQGKVAAVRVNMGAPELAAEQIPVICEKKTAIAEVIKAGDRKYRMTCVSMGNPHAVVFLEEGERLEDLDIEKIGPLFEHHQRFPQRVNTEFVKVTGRKSVEMRVWERGSGETQACGTGACAVVAASILNDLTDIEVTVKLLGGELAIKWERQEDIIYMTGPAVTVFDGEIILQH